MTRYHLLCCCGAECFVRGEEDPETNGFEADTSEAEWEGGAVECAHESFECIGKDDHDTDQWTRP